MIWNKFIIHTTNNDLDLLSSVLMDFGINDIQIENNVQLTDEELNQMYADFKKELPEDDGSCKVSFYLDEDGCIPGDPIGTGDSPTYSQGSKVDMVALKEALDETSELFGMQPVGIEEELSDTKDWEDKWKDGFKTFEVDGIVIKPSWEEAPADIEDKVLIEIDPGMAFGTGLHETTRLCLKGLKKYIKNGDRVLDLGCGSGILGIAALKLKAGFVNAIDIDEQAVKTAYENFEINLSENAYVYENIYDKDSDEDINEPNEKAVFQLHVGDITSDEGLIKETAAEKYDIVFMNILAEVIVKILPKIDMFMKDDSVLITSGILKEKEALVKEAALENKNIDALETLYDGDWVSIVFRKRIG